MDWPSIISSLQGKDLTHSQIAKLCGCGQSTITDLLTSKSKEPRYALGRRLIELSTLDKSALNQLLANLRQPEMAAA
ncbi:hypothetical protein [Xenophilus sp. Marseille-Q4582]|uniref:hypothetical protein n=1 Tax=Xenophilus sp. Marseille-Q4582 TaxID=2866600 RepID=UPI001CE3C25B|nr:hypothetical protein [Xenophilus sp. Marseille-Q4582]